MVKVSMVLPILFQKYANTSPEVLELLTTTFFTSIINILITTLPINMCKCVSWTNCACDYVNTTNIKLSSAISKSTHKCTQIFIYAVVQLSSSSFHNC